MKDILFDKLIHNGKAPFLILFLMMGLCYPQDSYSESYTLSVGESITITQTAYGGGYIDNVAVVDLFDPHLSFTKDAGGSATITINSYFDYSTIVHLVFLECYTYLGQTRAKTYYRDITISCKYKAPDPSMKPTKVLLPEKVIVPLGEQIYVTPAVEPSGAVITSTSWEQTTGSAQYFRALKDGDQIRCRITGRSVGSGKVTVTVNGNEKLTASMTVECIDPVFPPPSGVFLPSTKEISVGKQCTLEPVLIPEKASSAYTWSSDDVNIATVSGGKVLGVDVGTTIIRVKTKNNLTATCKVSVVEQNGKDDEQVLIPSTIGIINGHQYVDLGLSVKWATCDVGASKPSECGAKYAWGETSVKSSYEWSTYLYGSYWNNVTNIGKDIKGTNYDVAYVRWGKNWRMPTAEECRELISKCTIKWGSLDGVNGYIVTGPNNNTIFIPRPAGSGGYRWTSTLASDDYLAAGLLVDNNNSNITVINRERYRGYYIRPVSSVDASVSSKAPSAVSVTTSADLSINESFLLNYTISPSDVTTCISWYSENPSVAVVSSAGIVTAKKAGTTKIFIKTSNGKSAYCNVTVKATSPISQSMAAKCVGGYSSFFLDDSGILWGCGRNNDLLGKNADYFVKPIKVMDDVSSASIGGLNTYAFITKKDGTLWGCGDNINGRLANGTSKDIDVYTEVLDNVQSAFAGIYHSLILKKDGSLWGCGDNSLGQLGDGTTTNRVKPVKIMDDVVSASLGYFHTLIVKKDGTLWACGSNNSGEFGDGTTNGSLVPVKVMDDVASVSAGLYFTIILKKDGTMWACGDNYYGQLGDGTTTYKATPIKIMDNVRSVSTGCNHTLVVKNDGSLWGCGSNDNGQLGDGTTNDKTILIKIMDGVASASGGQDHTLIVKKDGSLWACGNNSHGQLGDGTLTDRHYPVLIVKAFRESPATQYITISDAGYATFYSSQSAYTVPKGLSAQVVSGISNGKLLYKTIVDGTVSMDIPKGAAVMLVSNMKTSGSYMLEASTNNQAYSGTNLLHGSDEATTTTGDGYHYKLSYGQSGTNMKDVFGWYWGSADGNAFQIDGHKAWLVVPKTSSGGTRGYTIEGEATGIDVINTDNEGVYHDLQGRRISKPVKKGIYIRNGKIVINH